MQSVLEGLRIIDLSPLLPGQYATLLLADMGAEVIKVERSGRGDAMRTYGPFAPDSHSGGGAGFEVLNRNKQSIALDLKTDEGKEVFRNLARTADVVQEGFRPGVMDRLGLGYEALSADNPQLVYCALTGYGQSGPLVDRAGHDINYMALAGALDLTGLAGGPPIVPGLQIADMAGGLLAAIGMLAAVAGRGLNGKGRKVDVAMHSGMLSLMTTLAASFLTDGQSLQRGRTILSGRVPCYHIYQTADGRYMSLGALEPKFWQNFCNGLEREDLLPLQYDESEAAFEAVAAVFRAKTLDEWQGIAPQLDACCEPVLMLEEALTHPHVAARRMLVDTPAPQMGTPVAFEGGDDSHQPNQPAPRVGQHTASVLASLGYTEQEIEALAEANAIGLDTPDSRR